MMQKNPTAASRLRTPQQQRCTAAAVSSPLLLYQRCTMIITDCAAAHKWIPGIAFASRCTCVWCTRCTGHYWNWSSRNLRSTNTGIGLCCVIKKSNPVVKQKNSCDPRVKKQTS